ncbi:LysR family transcriptional regulator [Bradyrhizobium sp. USDA 4519]
MPRGLRRTVAKVHDANQANDKKFIVSGTSRGNLLSTADQTRLPLGLNALRLLRYALAATEHGSLRRVARAFGVQESTVSRNICALEQYLDMQLFERLSSGVRLTNEGVRWLEANRPRIEGLEEALTETSRRNQGSKSLRIGFCAPVGQEFLLRLIDRFLKVYPEMNVTIQDGSCGTQAVAVRRRSVDVSFMCNNCKVAGCRSLAICEERIFVLLADEHKLAPRNALTWEDLADETLLVPTDAEGSLLDTCFLKQLDAGSRAPVIERCHASHATTLLKVKLGQGVTIAGEGFAKELAVAGTGMAANCWCCQFRLTQGCMACLNP